MSILQKTDSKFTSILFLGDTSLDNNKNTFILDATIDYIILNRRLTILDQVKLQLLQVLRYKCSIQLVVFSFRTIYIDVMYQIHFATHMYFQLFSFLFSFFKDTCRIKTHNLYLKLQIFIFFSEVLSMRNKISN